VILGKLPAPEALDGGSMDFSTLGGASELVGTGAVMDNLIGDEVHRWPDLVADPPLHVHIYGKGEARPGRKMGHVTRVIR
jgi:5-(carboxyamino)imidazole ribonucleotide synthase